MIPIFVQKIDTILLNIFVAHVHYIVLRYNVDIV